ncbi:MAG TPA: TonB-dependent siderophore receptor [Candidatus Sulfotelmatobacter sp.]|nr:TonB-dependent siderophore receptor [Candidatus Sulfotelmatobacter sp.]
MTYRFVAMGTLMAYTAFGATKITLAQSPEPSATTQAQSTGAPTPVRRFDIPAGSLDSGIAAFENLTHIHASFVDDGIRSLASPGVQGLYTDEQALVRLLDDSGVTYRFTAPDAIMLRLVAASSSVNVTADATTITSMPKYDEPLIEVPQTVSVVTQTLLQEEGTTTLRDALRNVAGISLAAGEGGAQGDNLTIRGFTARNDIFLDGMRDFGSYYRDSFNYHDVDVLQGPTSVTFGRGSTGGVVNQESKVPVDRPFINGSLVFGSDATRRITADINQPIGKQTAFRLNLMGVDQEVAGRDIAQNRRFGVAPSLAFGLGTSTRLTLSYLHEQADDNPDYGIPWLFDGPAPVDRSNYYGFEHGDYLRTDVDIATARFEHDVNSWIKVSNQARYGHYKRAVQITEAKVAGTLDLDTPLEDINVNRNQIAVNSLETFLDDQFDVTFNFDTGFLTHSLVTGVEGSRETSSPTRFAWANVPGTSLLNPDESQPFSGTSTVSSDVHAISISFGAYAVDTVRLGRHFDLIGGMRWDRFDTDYTSQSPSAAPSQFSRVDQQPSYRAAFVYKPVNYGSVYFEYGTSFNPSAETLALSAGTADLAPEKNCTYEVGTKWDLPSKRLSIDASVFQTGKENARETSPTNPLLVVLAGNQRVNGFQVAVTGRITDKWQLLSSYAYLDGKVIRSQFFPAAVGAQLANVPKNTFNAWTTYNFPWRFTAGAGTQFVDSRTASSTVPLDPTTGLVKQIPSYWVFNAMASHPLTERLSLQLNFYNLANRYYFDEPHPGHIVPGPAFTALVGLNFKF